MAISVGTSTATSGAAGTTGFTLVINSGVQAGDLLVLGVTNRDATATPTVTDNDTGGNSWSRVTTQSADTNGSGSVWWKYATGSTASKTITVSGCTGSASGCVTPYRGTAQGLAEPLIGTTGEGNASGNESQPGITVTRNGSYVGLFVFCTSNDTLNPDSYTATSPAALTERSEGVSSSGSDCSCSHASAEKVAAGDTGTISWSQTNGTGASVAFEILAAATIDIEAGSFSITGTAAGLELTRTVAADAGSVGITGSDVSLSRGFTLDVSAGSLAITGTDSGLTATRALEASAGSVAVTGSDADLTRGLALVADAGSVVVTGSDATLTYEQNGGYTLNVDAGSVAVTGTEIGLAASRTVFADPGALTIAGSDVALTASLMLAADAGNVEISGSDVALTYGTGQSYELDVDAGSVVLTGLDLSFVLYPDRLERTGSVGRRRKFGQRRFW